jgi:hypothetical protein
MKSVLIAAPAVLTAGRAHLPQRLGLTGRICRSAGDRLAGGPPTFLASLPVRLPDQAARLAV